MTRDYQVCLKVFEHLLELKVVYFMMKTCTYFKYVNVYLYEMNNFSLYNAHRYKFLN